MYNLNWSRKELTPQKLGVFGEYYAKMSLMSYGISVYTTEVDDHGIDFVAETKKGFLKFQVKTVRDTTKYVFMKKDVFDINDTSLYLLLLILTDGEHPNLYAVPATSWNHRDKTAFVFHPYDTPEYGINLSKKNWPQLAEYEIENFIKTIQ